MKARPRTPSTRKPAVKSAKKSSPSRNPILGPVIYSPRSILLPYQLRWSEDAARFKMGLWARQTGKSFCVAEETVRDSLQRKTTWVTMSAGDRQALEWMRKAREWVEAYKIAVEQVTENRSGPEALLKSAEIEFPNGSRIVAIPANPDTARGYSCNVNLDEFAFHEDPDGIWGAIAPSITNPLKGELRLRIVTTPNGTGNKAHQIWTANKRFTKHKITITDAKAAGLPVDLDELRELIGDPEIWAQEFECEFLDQASILLPYDVIALAESAEASETVSPEFWRMERRQFPVDLGIDFGRKKHLTVCWAMESLGEHQVTREVMTLRGASTPAQLEILRPRIRAARRVAFDYTGPGVGLGDLLVQEFGEWDPQHDRFGKVELCTFTADLKADIFSKLRMAFDSRNVRIPISRWIREDLHSVHRVITPHGNITYRAPMTEDGHADAATALALCRRANSFAGRGVITDVRSIRVGGNSSRTFRPRILQIGREP